MELLVKWADNAHPDPAKDERGCWKRGDVVVVKPDGHVWGKEELRAPDVGGRFVVVRIQGDLPEATIGHLLAPEHDPFVPRVRTRRRAAHLDLDAIAPAMLTVMARTGTITLTASAVRSRLVSKVTRTAVP